MESGTVTAGAAAEAWVVAVGAAPEALGTSAALGARALALGAGWSIAGAVLAAGGGADQVGEDGRGGALDRRSHGARFDRVQCAYRGCDLRFRGGQLDVGCVDVWQMNGGSWGKRDGGDDAGRGEAGQQI